MIMTSAQPRRGHSLAELVISMSTATVLVSGLAGTLWIAAQAVAPDDPQSRLLESTRAVTQLLDEIQLAKSVTVNNSTSITFTVGDQTGDDRDETIQYRWSGSPGEALTRSFNGGDPQPICPQVHRLALSYTITVRDAEPGISAISGQNSITGQSVTATATTSSGATRQCITSVRVRVQTSSARYSLIESSTGLLNEPEVP